jgi:hypothetical protein
MFPAGGKKDLPLSSKNGLAKSITTELKKSQPKHSSSGCDSPMSYKEKKIEDEKEDLDLRS